MQPAHGAVEVLAALLDGAWALRLERAARLVAGAGSLSALHGTAEGRLVELGLSLREAERLAAAWCLIPYLAPPVPEHGPLLTPEQAYERLLPFFAGASRERFVVLVLDAKNRPRHAELVAEGSLESCPVDPRQVFATALKQGGSSILCAHNHPSGELSPSAADVALTARLVEAGDLLTLPLIDHLIISSSAAPVEEGARFVSLAALGVLEPPVPQRPGTRRKRPPR